MVLDRSLRIPFAPKVVWTLLSFAFVQALEHVTLASDELAELYASDLSVDIVVVVEYVVCRAAKICIVDCFVERRIRREAPFYKRTFHDEPPNLTLMTHIGSGQM